MAAAGSVTNQAPKILFVTALLVPSSPLAKPIPRSRLQGYAWWKLQPGTYEHCSRCGKICCYPTGWGNFRDVHANGLYDSVPEGGKAHDYAEAAKDE